MKLLHQTSNGLESYNKHFNGICPTSHPNLVSFAHALRQEAGRVVQHMDNVAKGQEIPPDYNERVYPQITPGFYADKKKATTEKGQGKAVAREVVIKLCWIVLQKSRVEFSNDLWSVMCSQCSFDCIFKIMSKLCYQ